MLLTVVGDLLAYLATHKKQANPEIHTICLNAGRIEIRGLEERRERVEQNWCKP